jgi:hypothetical protein
VDPVVAGAHPVDHHPEGEAELAHHVESQPQVVQAEGRGLGDQDDQVRVLDRGDDRARGTGCASRMAVLSRSRRSFTARITGGAMATPTSIEPCPGRCALPR